MEWEVRALQGRRMPAQLLSLSEGPSVLLDKPVVLVGRHEECDLQLNSRKVSRKHCCIAQVRDYLVVRDLGSTNGVRINGARVTEGILRTGDELTIGNFRYQVHAELPRDAAVSPPVNAAPAPARAALLVDDDDLESVDMPVPLEERGGPPPVPPPRVPPAAASDASVAMPDSVNRSPESSSIRPTTPK